MKNRIIDKNKKTDKVYDEAFRACVKPMGNDVFYRVEWSLVPYRPIKEALDAIRIGVKIDKQSSIECLSTSF